MSFINNDKPLFDRFFEALPVILIAATIIVLAVGVISSIFNCLGGG